MSRRSYEKEKYRLQVELLKLQAWVKESGERVVVVFEGRDAAGKGGTIRRFMEHLNPRGARVVALEKPSEIERGQWYVQHLPTRGEIVLFDRSWYNRAGVERVMGFCSQQEYLEFLRQAPEFERNLNSVGSPRPDRRSPARREQPGAVRRVGCQVDTGESHRDRSISHRVVGRRLRTSGGEPRLMVRRTSGFDAQHRMDRWDPQAHVRHVGRSAERMLTVVGLPCESSLLRRREATTERFGVGPVERQCVLVVEELRVRRGEVGDLVRAACRQRTGCENVPRP